MSITGNFHYRVKLTLSTAKADFVNPFKNIIFVNVFD